tara:strand:- start:488 stop:805 length:318 start_codon:yes stop_codon:yes gene_type:complete
MQIRTLLNLTRKYNLELNKTFLGKMFREDFEGGRRWFDTLDVHVSAARQRDRGMTLQRFLDLLEEPNHIVLQVNGDPSQRNYLNEFPLGIGLSASTMRGSPDHFA